MSARLADVAGEPLKMLLPIMGYEKVPLESIRSAIQPLIPLVPNIEQMLNIAEGRYAPRGNVLTGDEHLAMLLYTMGGGSEEESFHTILNTTLRGEGRIWLKPWNPYLRLILNAFTKLPSKPGPLTVYRGVKLDLSSKYPVGTEAIWWGFSSCSKRIQVLANEHFLGRSGPRTLFVIECFSGKCIQEYSQYPDEEEFLLPPGCLFQIEECVTSGDDFHTIRLKEIQPKYPLINPIALVLDPARSRTPSPPSPDRDLVTWSPASCTIVHVKPKSAKKINVTSIPQTDSLPTMSRLTRTSSVRTDTSQDDTQNLNDSHTVILDIVDSRQ